ncbi:MAG: hypothetical protein ACYC8T_01650 [Myxococcaceae bacterium]
MAGPAGLESALARVRTIETLEDAYEAWAELRLEHAARSARVAGQQKKLAGQGEFLVGAVRAASAGGAMAAEPALATRGGLDGFLEQAEARLGAAREELLREAASDEDAYSRAFGVIREVIRERVARFLTAVKPGLSLMVRHVGPSQRILHLARVKPDEAVLLLHLLTGRIPSRYGFLFDDSTDDVLLAPPGLYPDEGVAHAEIRPGAQGLLELLRKGGEVLPVKGLLPVPVPRPGGGEDLYRLVQRGPVMEVELAAGDGFRNVLTREEAEAFAGFLLRLKLEGRITLEIEPG